jgi:hypothetical protein
MSTKAKPTRIMADLAAELLSVLGCEDDPVDLLNRNATPDIRTCGGLTDIQLLSSPHTSKASASEIPARRIKLRFWGGKGRDIEGTLEDLLIDRLQMSGLAIVPKRRKVT